MYTEKETSLKDVLNNISYCESCIHKGLCKFELDYDDIFNKIKEDVKELALLYKDMRKSPMPFSPTVFCGLYHPNKKETTIVTRSLE